jgi:hypothetical protein
MPKGMGFRDYVRSAFNARPWGMPIPPNWLALAGFGMLGILLSPGFLVIGLGAELGYLFALSTNARFQNYVNAMHQSAQQLTSQQKLENLLDRLWPDGKKRFFRLQERCESVLEFYASFLNVGSDITGQLNQSLIRFAWIFLQLLLTKQAISRIVKENSFVTQLKADLANLEKQISAADISPDLKKSLESKHEIIEQRLAVLGQAEDKLKFIDSELDRIEQQVELIREQAVISKDSQALSTRIDLVSSSLGETTDWIKQQQNLFGAVQDMVEEPPVIVQQSTERQ